MAKQKAAAFAILESEPQGVETQNNFCEIDGPKWCQLQQPLSCPSLFTMEP